MLCKNCNQEFTITDEDQKFYRRVDVPEPTHCPDCRSARRMVWRNEIFLYPDKCDLCSKDIISIYSPDKKVKVYCPQCYWSDKWEASEYGREFDFSRPFFDQFKELMDGMPRIATLASNNVNSDYVNFETDDKDCYMNVGGHYNENCYYNTYALRSRDSVDNYWLFASELCYELINGFNCYDCAWGMNIHDCRDCYLCTDCRGCENCIGCSGLRQQKYMIFNQACTPEEFTKKKAELRSRVAWQAAVKQAKEIDLATPKPYIAAAKCEDVTGDYLTDCKRCRNVFEAEITQDSKYLYIVGEVKDSYDLNSVGLDCQLAYDVIAATYLYNVKHSAYVLDKCRDLAYSVLCRATADCFGCFGLNHGSNCLLNEKYSKEQYDELIARVKEHMIKTGEWGEFFPINFSPFGYNETVAQDYFPITKDEALARGLTWQDTAGGVFGKETIKGQDLPDDIDKVSDSIVKEVIACNHCQKNYKILDQEFNFYKKQGLFLSQLCPNCRRVARLKKLNGRTLHHRQCMCENTDHGHEGGCKVEFETTYAPDRPEKVYCEECYRKEIY